MPCSGRKDATRAHAKNLHTLKSHALRAGLDDSTASSVAGALRTKAKETGVTGTPATMVRKTDSGVCFVRNARRYSAADFRKLAAAYNPRAARFVAAREILISY